MNKIKISSNSVHEENFFTFETSWIGNEYFDFENHNIYIPILNIYTENKEVLKYYNIKDDLGVFIEQSFFFFEGVTQIEKKLSIHSNDMKSFIERVTEIVKLGNDEIDDKVKWFELGGMGIFKGRSYDGLIRVNASHCYFIIPKNQNYRIEFKSLNDYNPFDNEWLNNINKKLKTESP